MPELSLRMIQIQNKANEFWWYVSSFLINQHDYKIQDHVLGQIETITISDVCLNCSKEYETQQQFVYIYCL